MRLILVIILDLCLLLKNRRKLRKRSKYRKGINWNGSKEYVKLRNLYKMIIDQSILQDLHRAQAKNNAKSNKSKIKSKNKYHSISKNNSRNQENSKYNKDQIDHNQTLNKNLNQEQQNTQVQSVKPGYQSPNNSNNPQK